MQPSPGGFPPYGSRFGPLPLDQTEYPDLHTTMSKRKRTSNEIVAKKLTFNPTTTMGVRYLLMKPSNKEAPITMNPFKLAADIDKIAGKVEEVSRLRNGEVLVIAKNINQAKKLKGNQTLFCTKTPVTIEDHPRLNITKGIRYSATTSFT